MSLLGKERVRSWGEDVGGEGRKKEKQGSNARKKGSGRSWGEDVGGEARKKEKQGSDAKKGEGGEGVGQRM